MAQWVKPLPSAQVMISGSWDRAPHRALCSAGSLLLPLSLPAALPTCDSLSLCQINKLKKKKKSFHDQKKWFCRVKVQTKTIELHENKGTWVSQWVKPLPSAQVMISGSWDRAPHRALCSGGSLLLPLSLPAALPTCDSLSLCQINKIKS